MANLTTQLQAEELAARFNFSGKPLSFEELNLIREAHADELSIEFKQQTDNSIAEASGEFARRKQILARAFDKQRHDDLCYAEGQNYYFSATPEEHQDNVDAASRQLAVARHNANELSSLYEGWTRFYLVLNAGGHVHSSTSCSSCFVTTEFGWLPLLSGSPADDLIDHFGTSICTICFPNAPVDARWDAAVKDEAKLPADICPGSGKAPVGISRNRRYGECEACKGYEALAKYGSIVRKHKSLEAKAAAKDAARIARNKASREANAKRKEYRDKRAAEGR